MTFEEHWENDAKGQKIIELEAQVIELEQYVSELERQLQGYGRDDNYNREDW